MIDPNIHVDLGEEKDRLLRQVAHWQASYDASIARIQASADRVQKLEGSLALAAVENAHLRHLIMVRDPTFNFTTMQWTPRT